MAAGKGQRKIEFMEVDKQEEKKLDQNLAIGRECRNESQQ